MKAILLLLLNIVVCPLAFAARVDVPGYDHTNEGNEFYVGFFRNRFGRANEPEVIDPVVCILTRESGRARVDISSSQGRIQTVNVRAGNVVCVDIDIGFVVFDSTEDTMDDSQFKGIHIQARNNRRIIVFGQNEEVASNDGFVALPIIPRPAGSSYEFIAASVQGDAGTTQQAKDSVVLIVGTEDNTQIILEPRVVIPHAYASLTGGNFIPGTPVGTRTVTIQRFQTFYLQVRGQDISGTRIIANQSVSVFSGHECANIPLANQPCDMLIEQVPPVDTWGTEVVTIPLITRSADTIKVFASQDSTTVNVTRTDIDSGMVTSGPSFNLDRNGFMELVISDYTLIQSNNPIGVFQFSRSYTTDNVLISDPFMLWVPPCEQYRDSYAVAPLPFDPSIEGSIMGRTAYVNYTNIAVPAEYFNASMITVNNNTINASEFNAIRRSDNSIWGYGAQLTLDVGAQVIQHQDSDAALSVTMYGFSNQQSWGCAGGTGLAPLTIAVMECSDITVVESDGNAVVQCTRSGATFSSVSFSVTTVDGTATAGNDYTAVVTREFTFGPGESSVSIPIPIIDDSVPESQEMFILSIVPNPNIVPPDDDPVVTVIDDDGATIEFSAPRYTTMESTGVLQAALITSLPLNSDYQVRVRFFTGTASRNDDITGSPLRITVPAGETRVNFSVPVTTDGIFEGTETFDMRLQTLSSAEALRVEVGTQGTAVGEIIDAATVMFNQTMYSVDETDGSVQIGLVLSEPPSTDTIVQVTNTDGSATGGGVDYDSGPYTVTIPAGQTTATFNIPITADSVFEGTENFMLTIDSSSLPTGLTVGNPGQATVTIVEEDITVMFNQTMYSVREGAGPAQPVLVLSNPSTSDITVQVTNTDGSAIGGGVDYTSGPYTVTFLAGQTTATFDVPINDDDIYEGNENFMLTIDSSSLPGSVRLGTPSEATVTIVDDDPITVMFNQSMYSVVENAGPAQPVLVLSNPSSTDTIVEVYDTRGSATGGGVDYTSGPYTVTFPAGQTTATFDVPINDDDILEGNEDFMLTINETSLRDGVTRGNPGQATVTIVDDDPLTVTFSQTTYTGLEQSGVVSVTLLLEGGTSSSDIDVTVIPSDQSPVSAQGNGVDYTSTPITATFPAGATSVTIDVPVTVDSIAEQRETFDLSFTIPSSLSGQVSPGRITEAVGAILDDTPTTVMFTETTYSVNENGGSVEIGVELSNPSSTDTIVEVYNTDRSATGGGEDYTSGPYTVTIPAGQTTATFNIPINNDDILEPDEIFMLTINETALPPDVTRGNPGEATVTIVDDDPITVMFSETIYSVNESAGPAQPVLVLSNPSSTDTIVRVREVEGSATRTDDYGRGPYTVTIPAGVTMFPFDIPIADDNILEGNEDFDIIIVPGSLPDDVSVGNPGTATVTIIDDDPITVMFTESTYTVNENGGSVEIGVELSNPSSSVTIVEVYNTDRSATGGGVDYTSGPYTVTIPAGQTTATFNIPINNDDILEIDEIFTLTINETSLPPDVTRGNPGEATVTIVDNDPITVMFSQTTYNVNENAGPAQPVLVLSNPSSTEFTVRVRDDDNTATGDVDYDSGPYTVTFPAGVTMVTFDVPITDDMILENNEDFDLIIVPGSLPNDVTRGNPGRATINIVDNDRVTVRFEDATDTVSEGDGTATITIIKEGDADIPVTVTVTTSDGSATAGSDYGTAGNPNPPVITPITIPAGVSSVDITVDIIDDDCREEDETFNADLTVLPNQAVDVGSPDRTVITIEDDDESTVEFINAPYTVSEIGGSYNVCLSITPACDRRAEVDLVTEPKDALPNEDYFPVRRTVSFAPNQMVSCVQMDNIISDNLRETDECFSLVIDPPDGSDLVPGGNANVTIIDNTIITSPGMFNDTVIGDPLYEVPLNMISNDTFPVTTSLCYEIHGEAGKVFNLISDGCVQVNANYSAMDIPENGNIISQIGVFAYDTAGGCVEILVDVNDCIPVVNGTAHGSGPGYDMNGVTARRRNGRARIAVPNCANELFDNLVFWVTCQDIGGQKMIKFQVVRGNQLIPDSHGLIGQFWNIPVSADIFTGDLTTDSPVTPYVVTVDHPNDPPRRFVAELFERTWDKSRRPCLYAGDGQGGSILDPVTPNDPVIAGTFRDYEVSDLFATDFIYNKLEERKTAPS